MESKVNLEIRNSEIALLKPSADEVSHLAVDIGGTLIKIVYFSINDDYFADDQGKRPVSNDIGNCHLLRGRLHFVKFETSKINDCLEFIKSKQLHVYGSSLL